jgi:predicted 3-demethylubiquinone-9 3-methyltransferase (glyoxalase superfamily)
MGGDMAKPAKNTICVWYNGGAEDAARFYAETFPDSSVGAGHRAPEISRRGRKGMC